MAKPRHRITLCMGSSCFSRGNGANVQAIEAFLAAHGLDASVEGGTELVGTLCEELCKDGPIMVLDGVLHRHVTEATLPEILATLLPGQD